MQCYVLSRKILYRISSEWWRCNGVLPHRASAAAFSTSQQRFTNEAPPAAKKLSNESKAPEVNSAISHDTRTSDLPLVPMGERVKQAGKDVFWTGIVIAGVGVMCVMGYAIFHELLSSKSPSGVYAEAFKLCKKDVRVKSVLGEPIKAYGELGGMRGRRRHVRSAEFSDGNSRIIQLKFYLSGPHNTATVYAEKDVTASTYRNLIFETDDRRERFSLLTPPESKLSSSLFS